MCGVSKKESVFILIHRVFVVVVVVVFVPQNRLPMNTRVNAHQHPQKHNETPAKHAATKSTSSSSSRSSGGGGGRRRRLLQRGVDERVRETRGGDNVLFLWPNARRRTILGEEKIRRRRRRRRRRPVGWEDVCLF